MMNKELIPQQNCRIDAVNAFLKFHIEAAVLRLDLLHPVISGNKWFKLKEYLKEAGALNKKSILTFGGAFSNHIVATAAAAKQFGFNSVGLIRGEKPEKFSDTLNDALSFGMKLFFISREEYKKKIIPNEVFEQYDAGSIYIINEGGYGLKGAEGAGAILKPVDASGFTHIVSAVGTGTTLAGLLNAATPSQKITGFSVMKNNFSLQKEIEDLLIEKKEFHLIHDYHFGGYAKYNLQLIAFMNEWYRTTGIPSDFVYTGKLFFAVNDLVQKNYFPLHSKILIIHSGGLQGNRSLPKGTLIF